MIDDECGAVGGVKIGRANRSIRRKPAPVPLCPPKIPHDLTWAGIRVAAVGNRRLTAWAIARPLDFTTLMTSGDLYMSRSCRKVVVVVTL
jgi:hypothetical protein